MEERSWVVNVPGAEELPEEQIALKVRAVPADAEARSADGFLS